MFPGNEDIYYDDNAHASQALISCFERTGNKAYLRQAREILAELILPAAQKDGGVPWHINNSNARNACSTGPAAVAALRICAIEHDGQMFQLAERGLRWMIATLRDPEDGLLWDSLVFDEHGNPNINKMKWTYNIGFAIHGFTLLYELTGRREDLDMAISLAHAAMNRKEFLFDRSIRDPEKRMYSDSSFFLHHLVDGYRVLSKHAHAETERLRAEIHMIAEWGREWIFDPADGLYFRGSSPYTIDEERVRRFNAKFGMNKGLEKNAQERDEKGELCKTLLGCSGWIRILNADESRRKA
jgi:rhamnogalacturonyl hydrolase YesR